MPHWVIGVDLDNTLVRYDELMVQEAVSRGLLSPDVGLVKRSIRDRIRQRPQGEIEWQKLQALVYGPKIGEANLAPGAKEFLISCRAQDVQVYVISHKTMYANFAETPVDLRTAALNWMRAHRFFDPQRMGLHPQDVFFESTRSEKIRRIASLGCTHFIDDLEETFLEEGFPAQVEKILYAPGGAPSAIPGVRVAVNWRAIDEYVGSSLAQR